MCLEQRERKRTSQQAEQKGRQTIEQVFAAAAAAKKQKKTDWLFLTCIE